MRLIGRSQGHGKTLEAIRVAAEKKAYLLVLNHEEKVRVVKLAEEMGLKIRNPVTFDEFFRDKMRGSFVRNVVIDNMDHFVKRLFASYGLTVDAATVLIKDTGSFIDHTLNEGDGTYKP